MSNPCRGTSSTRPVVLDSSPVTVITRRSRCTVIARSYEAWSGSRTQTARRARSVSSVRNSPRTGVVASGKRAEKLLVQLRSGDLQGNVAWGTVLHRGQAAKDLPNPSLAVTHTVASGYQHLIVAWMFPHTRTAPASRIPLPARFGQIAGDVVDLQRNRHVDALPDRLGFGEPAQCRSGEHVRCRHLDRTLSVTIGIHDRLLGTKRDEIAEVTEHDAVGHGGRIGLIVCGDAYNEEEPRNSEIRTGKLVELPFVKSAIDQVTGRAGRRRPRLDLGFDSG